MRNMIHLFKPKPVLMRILRCAVFSEKDKGSVLSSGYCSNILVSLCPRVSVIQMHTGDRVGPGGPPGNQAGPPAIGLVVST